MPSKSKLRLSQDILPNYKPKVGAFWDSLDLESRARLLIVLQEAILQELWFYSDVRPYIDSTWEDMSGLPNTHLTAKIQQCMLDGWGYTSLYRLDKNGELLMLIGAVRANSNNEVANQRRRDQEKIRAALERERQRAMHLIQTIRAAIKEAMGLLSHPYRNGY